MHNPASPGGGKPRHFRKGASAPERFPRKARRSAPGFDARQLAVRVISGVLDDRRPFEEAFDRALQIESLAALEPRDRAFARLIVATVLRRRGEFEAVLKPFIGKPLPERRGRLSSILLSATAQLLALDTPPHAAISLAVDQCRTDRDARRFDKLVNAVLRRVATEGPERLKALDAAALNVPGWMLKRWRTRYGETQARRIATSSLVEAPLDLSVKSDVGEWAKRLHGVVLATGSIRLAGGGRIEDLAGYAEGAWWVQDAAAALPARLFGDVAGLEIADLCAAPGGKTAELAAAGANVTAVDQSGDRLARIKENLKRLSLRADVVQADTTEWAPGRTFDGVLLDAPCTSTGTIRRHPDILHLKREADVAVLAALQSRLLDNAGRLVKPGGFLIYCTCSLEPEEGEEQIARFLARSPGFASVPITSGECGIEAAWITDLGHLRTLPFHLENSTAGHGGMDGFFAARLRRLS